MSPTHVSERMRAKFARDFSQSGGRNLHSSWHRCHRSLAEALDDSVDDRRIDDEGRRQQHMSPLNCPSTFPPVG